MQVRKFPFPIALRAIFVLFAMAGNGEAQQLSPELGVPLDALVKFGAETGFGTRAVTVGPEGDIYVLDNRERCVWVYDPNGQLIRKVSSQDADLAQATDLAIGRSGEIILIVGSEINILSSEGILLYVFGPEGRQVEGEISGANASHVDRGKGGGQFHSLAVLANGNILANASHAEHIITVYDATGIRLYGFGEPPQGTDEDYQFAGGLLRLGLLVPGEMDEVFFILQQFPKPTIQKYATTGQLLAEWNPRSFVLDRMARSSEAEFRNLKADSRSGSKTLVALPLLFNGAAYHRARRSLLVHAGTQLLELDASGQLVNQFYVRGPGKVPLPARRIAVNGERVLFAAPYSGVYSVELPPLP